MFVICLSFVSKFKNVLDSICLGEKDLGWKLTSSIELGSLSRCYAEGFIYKFFFIVALDFLIKSFFMKRLFFSMTDSPDSVAYLGSRPLAYYSVPSSP